MRLTPGLCPGVLRLRVRTQANPIALLSTALQAGRDIFFILRQQRQQREQREREDVTLYQLTSKWVDRLIDFHCIWFLC